MRALVRHPLAGIAAGSVLMMSWIIVPALLMWSMN